MKSRVMANAFRELIADAGEVYIMGHPLRIWTLWRCRGYLLRCTEAGKAGPDRH